LLAKRNLILPGVKDGYYLFICYHARGHLVKREFGNDGTGIRDSPALDVTQSAPPPTGLVATHPAEAGKCRIKILSGRKLTVVPRVKWR
jgi:hypothetical protein